MAKRGRRKHSVSVTLQPSTYYFLLGAVDGKKEKLGELINAIVDMVISKTELAELQAFAENLFKRPRKRSKTEVQDSNQTDTQETMEEPTEEGAESVDERPIVVPREAITDPAYPEGE